MIRSCILISFTLFTAASAMGGTIMGKITDGSGSPLIGVTVKLKDTHLGAITNKNGEYKIEHVRPGLYTLNVHAIGYESSKMQSVRMEEDEDVVVDLSLKEEHLTAAEIVVNGRVDQETALSARLSEKTAENIINVVSAETIERSPDRTSADVLQRVSGLSVQRDQGEARYVIFRGMDQRYNNTMLNGIKIPSPEPKARFVPLDVIPSDLLARINVTKALTPDMEGDAIGGTANLILRNAPSDPILDITAGGGYNAYFFNNQYSWFDKNAIRQDPAEEHGTSYLAQPEDFSRDNVKYIPKTAFPDAMFGLTTGDRFLNDAFGIVFSGSYRNTYRRTEGERYDLKNDINNVVDNVIQPTYNTTESRDYSTNRNRIGLYGKADYILYENQVLEASTTYVRLGETEARHAFNEVLNGDRSRAAIHLEDRSLYQTQDILSILFDGSHRLTRDLRLKWAGSYADASREQPDIAILTLDQNRNAEGGLDSTIAFDNMTRTWQHNDDKDLMGSLDLEFMPAGSTLSFKSGGLMRKKDRNNYQNDYRLNPDTTGGVASQKWVDIDHVTWSVYNNKGTSVYGYNNYTANETVVAGYAQSEWVSGQLRILGGVRFESTQQGYTTQAPINLNATSATINYTDILPSIHFTYQLTPEQNLRFSITKSLSRPSYFELVPYQISGAEFTEQGNYQLRRTLSTNVDMRYEFYPDLIEVLTAGVFYKNIVDPIELAFDGSNPASSVISPQNLGDAINYGFELVAAKRLGDFLVSGNYTYTHSSLKSQKIRYERSGSSDPVEVIYQETRPLVGQSPHILNLSVGFNKESWGTYAEVSYGFTGKRLALVSAFEGFDYFQNPLSELAISFNQRITERLKFFGAFTNLLNAPYELVLDDGKLIEHETYRASFELGIKYKL